MELVVIVDRPWCFSKYDPTTQDCLCSSLNITVIMFSYFITDCEMHVPSDSVKWGSVQRIKCKTDDSNNLLTWLKLEELDDQFSHADALSLSAEKIPTNKKNQPGASSLSNSLLRLDRKGFLHFKIYQLIFSNFCTTIPSLLTPCFIYKYNPNLTVGIIQTMAVCRFSVD